MIKLEYLTIDEAIGFHDEIIKESGGAIGFNEQNIGLLKSSLEQIQNDDYYPTLADKITHLMFACIKFHPFIDGNKRTSIALADHFMRKNNFNIKDFAQQMENVVVKVAENAITKDDLQALIEISILEYDLQEKLKSLTNISGLLQHLHKKYPQSPQLT